MSISKFEQAIAVEDQDAADRMFEQLVQECIVENANMRRDEAIETIKENLGYFAGYYSDDVRARVEKLYRCAHPVFGPIATTKPPTEAEAMALSVESGKLGRIITLAEYRKRKMGRHE